MIDVRRIASGLSFGPVADGKVLPTLPFAPDAPTLKPFDIWSRIMSAPVREAAVTQARSKAALHSAPA